MEKIFVGMLTKDGNKARARRIFFSVAARISKFHKISFFVALHKVFMLLEPVLNFSVLRRGSTNYVSPRRMSPWKAKSLVVRWIIQSANARSELGIISRLEGELNDLLAGTGRALKCKLEFQRRAVSNRFILHNVWHWKLRSYYLKSAKSSFKWFSKI